MFVFRCVALAALLLVAPNTDAVQEDRPLPPSPCPDVFSYEGATVDWDRWYGVVLVATDIPLTGLRLDVWLNQPALALRHNWDGNVTTLDNKRYTILNLYKRIEPGPPKSIRIVVKFDENKELPVLRGIELNGRRICSEELDLRDTARHPSARPDFHKDHPPGFRETTLPSNGKYNFDRTTRRPYQGSEDQYNIVSLRPQSELNSFHPSPSSPRAPSSSSAVESRFSSVDEISSDYENSPRKPAFKHDYSSPALAPRRPPFEDDLRTPELRRPSSDGGGKHSVRPADLTMGAPGYSTPVRRPAVLSSEEDDYLRPPRPPLTGPPTRRPLYQDESRLPNGKNEERIIYEAGEKRTPSQTHNGIWTSTEYTPSVRPLIDDYIVNDEITRASGRPTRQGDGSESSEDGSWVPPGHRRHGSNTSGNGRGKPNRSGPPGLSGNAPPGHGGPVPGHNKNKGNGHNNNNNNNNNDNYNNNYKEGQVPTEQPQRPASNYKPETTTGKEQKPVGLEECGRTLTVAPLITHGQGTSRGQWPWHAALYQNKGTDLKYICGGSLISPKYVITAAHCVTRSLSGRAVDPDTVIAYLGKYHLHRWTNEEGVQQGKVAVIHVHPEYNTSDFRADLALLELSTALTYTQYVRQVCLWGRHETNELEKVVGHEGYVVGWGYDEFGELTEELRMASMPIVDQQTCIYSYPEFYSRFTNNMTFCAGYKNGTSACNGDSGGGLVLPRVHSRNKVWYLRGLVSTSVAQESQRVCNTQYYVVFTDLAKYRGWISGYVN